MEKYPALRTASGAAILFGWAGIIAAVLLFIWGIIDISSTAGQYGGGNPFYAIFGAIKIGNALALGLMGVLLVLAGEVAKVFIDIERNTRTGIGTDLAPTTADRLGGEDHYAGAGWSFVPAPFEGIRPDVEVRHKMHGRAVVLDVYSRSSVRVRFHGSGREENVDPANLMLG